MKSLFIYLFAGLLFIQNSSSAQVQSVSLQAGGLTCSMCSRAIYKSLKKIPEVSAVKEDIAHSTYHIQFKNPDQISISALRKAVEDAGFSVVRLELKTKFDHQEVRNDSTLRINDQTFWFVGIHPQSLDGEKSLLLIDKEFLLEKDRKKYPAVAAEDKASGGDKVYHVTLLAS
jgi:copper chaperone CopZ